MKLPESIRSIAILRALQLGDMLCVIPAVRALRQAYPNAKITLLGLPWAASFVKRFDKYFDGFMHFPGYPGLPEQEYSQRAFMQFVNDIREKQFDLVLQMQGNGTIVNGLMPLFNGKYMAGFYTDKSFKPSNFFMPYPNEGHEVHRHIGLMQHLGIAPAGDELEFPLTEDDHAATKKLCLYLPPQKYVCIHPGSRGRWRQWPPKYFAALGDICVESGFTVIITGTKEESDITGELIKCMHHPVIDLTGCTSVGDIALLLKNAYLLIANCTGVSHIAAATKTRSVIISMDGEPERWGPINHGQHTTIDCSTNYRFDEVLQHIIAMMTQQQLLKRA
jgi:ADP-heptose:LPS heptosyltransferase